MGKKDKLRENILDAIEVYNTAANPPAINYAKEVETYNRIEAIPTSRTTQLRMGIDIKYIIYNYLRTIPPIRANNILEWIQDGSEYAKYQLTDYYRQWLIADRRRIQLILKDKGY